MTEDEYTAAVLAIERLILDTPPRRATEVVFEKIDELTARLKLDEGQTADIAEKLRRGFIHGGAGGLRQRAGFLWGTIQVMRRGNNKAVELKKKWDEESDAPPASSGADQLAKEAALATERAERAEAERDQVLDVLRQVEERLKRLEQNANGAG